MRGAWIEMTTPADDSASETTSLPVRGAWIEIFLSLVSVVLHVSLPVRGAWIEITDTVVPLVV